MLVGFIKVATIFAMVAVGYIANKGGILKEEANTHLVALLLGITNPCLIIASMAKRSFTHETIRQSIEVVVGSLGYFFLAMAISYFLVKLIRYKPAQDQGVLMAIMTSVNTAFMGFPMTKAIFGDDFFFLMVIENIVLNFYLYCPCLIQMNLGTSTKLDLKNSLKSLCNIQMLSVVIGIVLMIIPTKMPDQIVEFFDTVGQATIPVSMIVVGIQLGRCRITGMLKNAGLLFACFVNVAIMPLITFLVVNWLPLTNETKIILVFAAAFPGAVISVALASRENKNAALMAEGVALTTFLSMFTIPLWAMFINGVMM